MFMPNRQYTLKGDSSHPLRILHLGLRRANLKGKSASCTHFRSLVAHRLDFDGAMIPNIYRISIWWWHKIQYYGILWLYANTNKSIVPFYRVGMDRYSIKA